MYKNCFHICKKVYLTTWYYNNKKQDALFKNNLFSESITSALSTLWVLVFFYASWEYWIFNYRLPYFYRKCIHILLVVSQVFILCERSDSHIYTSRSINNLWSVWILDIWQVNVRSRERPEVPRIHEMGHVKSRNSWMVWIWLGE